MYEPIYGNHIGLVVNDQDPEKRSRLQIYIPHLSNTLYANWNNKLTDFSFKTLETGIFSTDIIQKLKDTLPWAEAAIPSFGGGTSGHVNSALGKAILNPIGAGLSIASGAIKAAGVAVGNALEDLSKGYDKPSSLNLNVEGNPTNINSTSINNTSINTNDTSSIKEYAVNAANLDNSAVNNAIYIFGNNPDGSSGDGTSRITVYNPIKDATPDSSSSAGIGNSNNILTSRSLAIAPDIKGKIESQTGQSLVKGQKIYVNGQYLGNYDDTSGTNGTIDIFDPHATLGESFSKSFDFNNSQFSLGEIEPQVRLSDAQIDAWKNSQDSSDYRTELGGTSNENSKPVQRQGVVDTMAYALPTGGGAPNGFYSKPAVGAKVWVFFHGGDIQIPVYFASVMEPSGSRTAYQSI